MEFLSASIANIHFRYCKTKGTRYLRLPCFHRPFPPPLTIRAEMIRVFKNFFTFHRTNFSMPPQRPTIVYFNAYQLKVRKLKTRVYTRKLRYKFKVRIENMRRRNGFVVDVAYILARENARIVFMPREIQTRNENV